MIINYKIRIYVQGLPEKCNFKLDNFIQKKGQITVDKILYSEEELTLLLPVEFMNSMVDCQNNSLFYLYLEQEKYEQIDFKDLSTIEEVQHSMIGVLREKVSSLECKIRLITGIPICFMKSQAFIYDINFNQLKGCSNIGNNNNLRTYTLPLELQNKIIKRTNSFLKYINYTYLANNNLRFKRALETYYRSMDYSQIPVNILLLAATIESLFNLKKDEYAIKEMIITASLCNGNTNSKIIFRKLYNCRNYYIHGNDKYKCDIKTKYSFTEVVRKVILMYIKISELYDTTNCNKIKELIDSKEIYNNQEFLDYSKWLDRLN